MDEILKQIQGDLADLKTGQHEMKAELQAIRGHMHAFQADINNPTRPSATCRRGSSASSAGSI